MLAAPGMAQWTQFSTFDQTTTSGSPPALREAWADGKAPGNGSIYLTGSIEVVDTATSPTFSGTTVQVPSSMPTFSSGFVRQVVIIQRSNAADGQITKQVYFYGTPTFAHLELPGLHTNVRAISVWPAATDEATRIAICGETSDDLIPQSQNTAAPTASIPGAPIYSGFIAVFDGNLDLKWTHHLYGPDPQQHCAATDVSIRVENGADIVTYCGISSHGVVRDASGNPTAANGSLLPVNWFTWASPTGAADGASNNGAGQWDGFVGRLRNPGSVVGGQTVQFHSVVGGEDQDGLFGLAELPNDRFVVVGSTATGATPGTGGLLFPFLAPNQPTTGTYCMGTTLVFDPLNVSASSRLQASSSIGTGATEPTVHTVARDVFVHLEGVQGDLGANPVVPPLAAIHIVGSTDDPSMFASVFGAPLPSPQALLNLTGSGGAADGFLITAADDPTAPLVVFDSGTFHGGTENDHLHGVAGWNEHRDHVTVFGSTEGMTTPLGNVDLELCSYFLDTPNGVVGKVSDLLRLRRTSVTATADQVPTAMGVFNVIDMALPVWQKHGLGSPAGGGVCVEERGRITMVGKSDAGSTYPSIPGPPQSRLGLGGDDAIRTDIDLLPVGPLASNGVGRTDGTGLPVAIVATATGGTTPAASLSPFGVQLGMPAPALQRINIDLEGSLPTSTSGGNANVLIDRPPFGSPVVAAYIHYGIPSYPMAPFTPDPTGSGIEWWMDPYSPLTTSVSQWSTAGFDQSIRFPLVFPSGSNVYVVQAICMLANGTYCGSPGLVVNY